jgi:hypothetical protein
MKSAANVGGNRLKTDWKRTCFSGFPPALAPELHSGAIRQGQIIASNACLSAPEGQKAGGSSLIVVEFWLSVVCRLRSLHQRFVQLAQRGLGNRIQFFAQRTL